MNNTNIIPCDFRNPHHRTALPELINMYINDEMGGGEILTENKQKDLLNALITHPKVIIFLALNNDTFAGLIIGFENISTFTAMPMINIHDVFVHPQYRGLKIGRQLMNAMISEGQKRGCSRITLEVRFDNIPAQKLYRSLDFIPCNPDMHFWRKYL
jgi:ribosomal protein S18 acetylase RimI-like enzyme